MKCAWCGQEIVLTAEEPTFYYKATFTVGIDYMIKEEVILHNDCNPSWEEWNNVN